MTLSFAAALLVLSGSGTGTPTAPFYWGPKPPPRPSRVVTLAPSLTECVVEMGLEERLVGVSRFDDARQVAQLPRVGGFVDPSVEAVLQLKPDLVLVQTGPGSRRAVERMAELGTPVLAVPMDTLGQIELALSEMGRALGAPERGEALKRQLESTRERIRRSATSLPHPRVLFVYGFEPLVVAGPGSFTDELVKDAGGVNAAVGANTGYAAWSVEVAMKSHPDFVIDASDTPAGKEALSRLASFRDARWVRLPSTDLLHPGPRLAHGLEELFAVLHGPPDAGR